MNIVGVDFTRLSNVSVQWCDIINVLVAKMIFFIFVGLGTCWVTGKLSTRSATEGWPSTTERMRRRMTADGRDSKK